MKLQVEPFQKIAYTCREHFLSPLLSYCQISLFCFPRKLIPNTLFSKVTTKIQDEESNECFSSSQINNKWRGSLLMKDENEERETLTEWNRKSHPSEEEKSAEEVMKWLPSSHDSGLLPFVPLRWAAFCREERLLLFSLCLCQTLRDILPVPGQR